MIDLKGKSIDKWGNVRFTEAELCDLLMSGTDIAGLTLDNDQLVDEFNRACKNMDHPSDSLVKYSEPSESLEQWDQRHQAQWFTPEPFASIDLHAHLMSLCTSESEIARVQEELTLFEQRGMFNLLRFLIYLVDHLRSNNILWGVGRGSSVSSYVLYLLNVHRINSIEYELDIREFLK